MSQINYQLQPIGFAKINEEECKYEIKIEERFRPALKELDKFTHVNIIWWAHRNDNDEKRSITQIETFPFFYGEIQLLLRFAAGEEFVV